jgi:hypothetical protein
MSGGGRIRLADGGFRSEAVEALRTRLRPLGLVAEDQGALTLLLRAGPRPALAVGPQGFRAARELAGWIGRGLKLPAPSWPTLGLGPGPTVALSWPDTTFADALADRLAQAVALWNLWATGDFARWPLAAPPPGPMAPSATPPAAPPRPAGPTLVSHTVVTRPGWPAAPPPAPRVPGRGG